MAIKFIVESKNDTFLSKVPSSICAHTVPVADGPSVVEKTRLWKPMDMSVKRKYVDVG